MSVPPPPQPPPSLPPLAIYLHFPWCVAKCPYCDFNSHALREALPEARYVAALEADLAAQAPGIAARPIVSVFLGGGTPSLFSPAAIGRLIDRIRCEADLLPDAEITLEANPGTIERGRFAEYRGAGITRVSLGAQSFAAPQLAALGRIHSADETRRAAAELHAAGLENFNLDLMYGLPGQSVAQAVADVDAALELEPRHLSHYQLTLEPGTLFGAAPPADLPGEDEIEEMLERCQARLNGAGFDQYEVSAYARAGARCRHNLNYWQFGDYLGIGAGAHGKLSAYAEGVLQIVRTTQRREPRRYLASAAKDATDALTPSGLERRSVPDGDLPFEFMMNALRLVDGFAESEWQQRSGRPWSQVAAIVRGLAEQSFLERRAGGWRATAHGLRFLNELLLRFLPDTRGSRKPESQAWARS
jgi:oxygen-independent coproporphyrinogen-3 oxidase